MAGRGLGRGRGNIHLTPEQLTTLLNEHVTNAIGAALGAQHQNPPGCTYKQFMDCKPHPFAGTEGAIGLLHWFDKVESVFEMCNCPQEHRVKYATGTLEGTALTWWKSQVQIMGLEMANATPWQEFKDNMKEEYCSRDEIRKLEEELWNLKMEGSEIEAYTKRANDLANLCHLMVTPPHKRIEFYLKGLSHEIQTSVTAASPATIQAAVRLAHKITDQAVEQGRLPPRVGKVATASTDNKQKWEGGNDRSASSSQQ